MMGVKPISGIVTGLQLVAVFARHLRTGLISKQISLDDFDKMKIIGKGGFAEKVYLARKKDTGSLVAIKTMCKKFILEE
jgi:serine/threonine protein kinase